MLNERFWYYAFLLVLAISILLPYLWPRPPAEMLRIPQQMLESITGLGTNPGATAFIEFGSLESPVSRDYRSTVKKTLEMNPSVNYIWIHLPSQQSISGQIAAVLLECMRDQGLFYESLFSFWDIENLTQQQMINAIAREGNATLAWECAKSGKKEDIVEQHLAWASAIRVVSPPTFFVNGRQILEPYTTERLTLEIKKA